MTNKVFGIGATAKRFGLAASTLRYWEECGLITPAVRRGRWRYYSHENLHRIALIQLWQDTGLMSLDEIKDVLTGTTSSKNWKDSVKKRIKEIDLQRKKLAKARGYLLHLLECPDINPAHNCPYLRRDTKLIIDAKSEPSDKKKNNRARIMRVRKSGI